MYVTTIIGKTGIIRLSAAFVIGLLLGIIADRIGAGIRNVVPYLLFPILVGIVGGLSIGANNLHPRISGLITALFAWAGITVCLGVLAARTAPSVCINGSCETPAVLGALLSVYLLLGFVLVFASSLFTSTVFSYYRLARHEKLQN